MFDLGVDDLLRAEGDLSLPVFGLALVLGFLLSLLLRWHFSRYSSALSNRRDFASLFPFIVLTVALVIAIVKSSLALSLGLVGALSIVRFRTPIKEPEELAYIFMAIAIGLGLGANQIAVTVSSTLLILFLVALVKTRARLKPQNLYLSFTQEAQAAAVDPQTLSQAIASEVSACELRRLDVDASGVHAVYNLATRDSEKIFEVVARLRETYPSATISLIDQHRIPGV